MLREMTPYEAIQFFIEDYNNAGWFTLRDREVRRREHYSDLAEKYGLTFNEAYYMENDPRMLRPRSWRKLERGGHHEKIEQLRRNLEELEALAEYQMEGARGN